jgi:hypothetical protein
MQFSAAHSTRRPSALELLLERFAVEMRYVPPQARLIDEITELPLALERKAAGCGSDAVWRAWIHDGRIWFIIGRLSPWSVNRPDRLMLHALFFNVEGELVSSGIWRREPSGQWTLCVA